MLSPLKDSMEMPSTIEDFKEWHYKVLRRLNKHAVTEQFTGIMTFEVNIPKFTSLAQTLKLVEIATYEYSLSLLKKYLLQDILKQYSFKVSGNKDILIERILGGLTENEIRNANAYTDFYILTPTGKRIIAESYERLENDNIEFFKTVLFLILEKEFDLAFRTVCKRNAESPIPPGINCNWQNCYYAGLSHPKQMFYEKILNDSADKIITASSIYEMMSGDSKWKIENYLSHLYKERGNEL